MSKEPKPMTATNEATKPLTPEELEAANVTAGMMAEFLIRYVPESGRALASRDLREIVRQATEAACSMAMTVVRESVAAISAESK